MNRRTFLKQTGNFTAIAAASRSLPAAAVSRSQTQSSAATASDVVVIGAGAFGGWTALYLREMGLSVTMVDQYGPGNSRATSGGETRQIRAGYGEREVYTRWVLDALERWKKREAEWKKKLLFPTGQITLAREWTKNLTDTRKVFDKLGVKYEVVDRADLPRRFPQMTMEGIAFGFAVPSTGVLKAREGCVAVEHAFEGKGGQFLTAKAEPGRRTGRKLEDVVLSTGRRVSAGTFVFACGPWLRKVFADVMSRKLITPRRVVFFYGTPPGDERFTFPNFPTWAVDDAYGFPSIEGKGFKVVPTFEAEMVDPDTQEHTLTADEIRKGRAFVTRWFPTLKDQPLVDTKVCQREDSVDEHFIVDRHPAFDNVWIVGGGSGHGYKHGIVLGDYVAHRVVGKDTQPELAPMFTLKDKTF
jgi:glycine/D-amino acid oxidase-like deaminating enzyme